MYRNSGEVELRLIFLFSAIGREGETRDPLKRVIKAQQDEAQLAISVTLSTCSKQMVGQRERGRERQRGRERSRSLL